MRRRTLCLIPPGGPVVFPDPRGAGRDGLVAAGGDLSVRRLLAAYERGIFPWYDEDHPPLWWSPDPRAILDASDLHVSRSMRRELRRRRLRVTFDQAFREVIQGCAANRENGTWIMRDVIDAYTELHVLGHAHSFEVWDAERLCGGLYGVHLGGLFAAESMFHRVSNASKLALIHAVQSVSRRGVTLFDVQFLTPHLASLGAREIGRDEYLDRLSQALTRCAELGGLEPEASFPLEEPR